MIITGKTLNYSKGAAQLNDNLRSITYLSLHAFVNRVVHFVVVMVLLFEMKCCLWFCIRFLYIGPNKPRLLNQITNYVFSCLCLLSSGHVRGCMNLLIRWWDHAPLSTVHWWTTHKLHIFRGSRCNCYTMILCRVNMILTPVSLPLCLVSSVLQHCLGLFIACVCSACLFRLSQLCVVVVVAYIHRFDSQIITFPFA